MSNSSTTTHPLAVRHNGHTGVPAAFAGRNIPDMLAAGQAGIQASFAVIKYKGSKWAIRHRGEVKHLLRDGAPEPFLDVVIVGVASGISKQYYDSKWREGDEGVPPACFSVDGVRPDAAAPKRQCDTCAACEQNVWGSKINDNGKKVKACDDRRRIAVVPYGDMTNEGYGGPMLLVLPPTSLANFANYCRELKLHSAQPCYIRTKIGFDYNVSHPLLTFTAAGWLSDEESVQALRAVEDPQVERMLEQEVVEVTHDPEGDPPSALAGGRPGAAFAPSAQAAQKPVQAPPRLVAPSPVQTAAPASAKPQGNGAAAPVIMPAPIEPIGGDDEEAALAKQLAEAQARKAARVAAAQAQAQASEPEPEPSPMSHRAEKPDAKVLQAPSDLESAIDNLLGG